MSTASYIDKTLEWFYNRLKDKFTFIVVEFGTKTYYHTFADNVEALFTFLTKNYTALKDSEWCHLVWYRSAIRRNDLGLVNFWWQSRAKDQIRDEGLLKVNVGTGALGVCELTINVVSNSLYMLERIEGVLAIREGSVWSIDGGLAQFWYVLQNIQSVMVGQHFFVLPISCMLYVALRDELVEVPVVRCIRLVVDEDGVIRIGECGVGG